MSKLILFLVLGVSATIARAEDDNDVNTESRAAVVRGNCADGVPSTGSKACYANSANDMSVRNKASLSAQACADTNSSNCGQNYTPVPAGAQSDANKSQ